MSEPNLNDPVNVPPAFNFQPSHPRVRELWHECFETVGHADLMPILYFVETNFGERALLLTLIDALKTSHKTIDRNMLSWSEPDLLAFAIRREASQYYLLLNCQKEGLEDEVRQFWRNLNLHSASISN